MAVRASYIDLLTNGDDGDNFENCYLVVDAKGKAIVKQESTQTVQDSAILDLESLTSDDVDETFLASVQAVTNARRWNTSAWDQVVARLATSTVQQTMAVDLVAGTVVISDVGGANPSAAIALPIAPSALPSLLQTIRASATAEADKVVSEKGIAETLEAFLSITGRLLGVGATFAALPTVDPENGNNATKGDVSYLNAAEVGTGTAEAPQYPAGFYFYNGNGYDTTVYIPMTPGVAIAVLTAVQLADRNSAVTGMVSGQLLFNREQALKGVDTYFEAANASHEIAVPWDAKTIDGRINKVIDDRIKPVTKADGDKPDAGRVNRYPAGSTPDYTGATADTYAVAVIGTTEVFLIEDGGAYVVASPNANITQSGRLWDDDVSYVPVDSFYFTAVNSTDISANGITTVAGQTYIGSYAAARDAADTPDPATATAAEITAEVALMNFTALGVTTIDPAIAEAAVDAALASRGVILPPINLTPFTRSNLWATENAEMVIPISEGATVKDISFQLGDRTQSVFDGGRQLPRETFTRQQLLVDGFGTGWAAFSTVDYNGRDRWARNYRDHVFNVNYRWFIDAILENNTLILNIQSEVSGEFNRWAGYKDLVVTFEAI